MTTARPTRLAEADIARHAHVGAYATLVLDGAYEEAGDAGRFRVEPGDVLIHGPFSAHRDAVAPRRTIVLDLPLPFDARAWPARGQLKGAGDLVRTAERDAKAATGMLIEGLTPTPTAEGDLPDRLAREVSNNPSLAVGSWSRSMRVSRETAWRQFRLAYGVDIATYRGEARARQAWRAIVGSSTPLAEIAVAAGFSDQAHMSRCVKAFTGSTPGQWRRHVATSVQDPSAPPR
ncbi:MAG TPA: AraC family transcriptional regulator [Hyphomonadaceae bacterium]|nr:AraC family transcriptional regulator [Hyphomonadaceae bacterium]